MAHTVMEFSGATPDAFSKNTPTSAPSYSSIEMPAASQPPSIHVFTRHSKAMNKKTGKPVCTHGDERFYKGCRCPKWVYVRHNTRNIERSAKTRSWAEAERYARKLAANYDPMEQALQQARQVNQPKVKDVQEAMADFLAVWADDEKAEQTIAKLRTTLLHKLLPWVRQLTPPIAYLHQIEPEHVDSGRFS